MKPIQVPLGSEADQIANLVLHLQTALAPTLTLTTLAVRRGGVVNAYVILHLADGSREPISSADARLMARVLRDDAPPATIAEALRCPFRAWAQSLEDAADAADRQASAILAGMAQGGWSGAGEAREFRGRA